MKKQIREIIAQYVGGTHEAKQKAAEEILHLFSVSGQLAEHKCKFYVNADWTGYSACECGKRHEG